MKLPWLAITGVAVALTVSACGGGGTPAAQSTGAGSAASAPTSAPTAAAAVSPAAPTAAPTVAPTAAPTMAHTVAPTVAATATAGSSAQASSAATPAKQVAPSGPAVGQGDIRAMAQAFATVKTFRVKLTGTGDSQDADVTMEMEVVRPDRQHIKMTVAGQTIESYVIGNDQYVNIGGKWTKATAKASQAQSGSMLDSTADPSQMVSDINDEVKSGGSLTKGAVSAVNGTPCQEWVVTASDQSGSGTMCIGLQNNLPLEFKTADGKASMTFYDYNKPITINPPI